MDGGLAWSFDPSKPSSWPKLDGRFEYVNGRLHYLPPCDQIHAVTAADVAWTLGVWVHANPQFAAGCNEAGMELGGDIRGADAAVWMRVGPPTRGWPRTPPLLAVEISGVEEPEEVLREKADWYRAHGVKTVWIVLPDTREVVVVTSDGSESRHESGAVPEPEGLCGLTPAVSDFFFQLRRSE